MESGTQISPGFCPLTPAASFCGWCRWCWCRVKALRGKVPCTTGAEGAKGTLEDGRLAGLSRWVGNPNSRTRKLDLKSFTSVQALRWSCWENTQRTFVFPGRYISSLKVRMLGSPFLVPVLKMPNFGGLEVPNFPYVSTFSTSIQCYPISNIPAILNLFWN